MWSTLWLRIFKDLYLKKALLQIACGLLELFCWFCPCFCLVAAKLNAASDWKKRAKTLHCSQRVSRVQGCCFLKKKKNSKVLLIWKRHCQICWKLLNPRLPVCFFISFSPVELVQKWCFLWKHIFLNFCYDPAGKLKQVFLPILVK